MASDLVAKTFLESQPALAKVTGTTASVMLVAGRTMADPDELLIQFSASPDLSGATELLVGPSFECVRGDIFELQLTGLSAGTTYYYRAGGSLMGAGRFYSEIWTFTTTPSHLQDATIVVMADAHFLPMIVDARLNRQKVHAQTMRNIKAEPGSLIIDVNDSVPYCHFNGGHAAVFPIDDTGTPDSPTSTFALSAEDCEYDVRLFRKYDESAHTGKMRVGPPGNHNGEHWWEHAANNSATNDVANYSRDAINKFFGNSLGAIALAGAEAKGRWGAFRYGAALICLVDPYEDARLSVSDPATSNPDQPDSQNDWCISQAQWDYFFHATTGWVTKASPTYDSNNPTYTGVKFIIFAMHNLIGGSGVSTVTYGRGGKQYATDKAASQNSREHGASATWQAANPRGWTGDHLALGFHGAAVKRCDAMGTVPIVIKGHDHFWAREFVDGVLYVTVPQSSGINDTPFSYGFKDDGSYTDADSNTVYKPNAGHVVLTISPSAVDIRYKRSMPEGLAASIAMPGDGVVVNGAVVDHVIIHAMGATTANHVVESGARTVDDSIAHATAGTTQTGYRKNGEPLGLTSQFGERWLLKSTDTGNAPEPAHLAIRTSPIDGARVISGRRPKAATATLVRLSAFHYLGGGLNRRVKWKMRLPHASATSRIIVYLCGNQSVVPVNTVINKGLYVRYIHGATPALGLYWDDGVADGVADAAAADVATYSAPVAGAFDAGLTAELVRNRVTIYGPTGAALFTANLSAAIMAALRGSTHRSVGMTMGLNNQTNAGYIQEIADFEAVSLGDAGRLSTVAMQSVGVPLPV